MQAEETVVQRVIAFFLQQGDGEKFAGRFAHFAVGGIQVRDVEPPRAPRVAQIAFRLRDFIRMMGKRVVDAATVQVEILAVVLQRDSGAFDMPAGIARAPRGIPF